MASQPNSNEDNLPTLLDFLRKGNFSTCNECDKIILERIFFKINRRSWHCYCLKCGKCSIPLDDMYCLNNRRKIFCSSICAGTIILCNRCQLEIPQTELCRAIDGNNYYHLPCFSCMKCCRQLNTDEKLFFINGEDILCEDDYEDTEPKEDLDTPGNSSGTVVRKPCNKQARTRFNEYQKEILDESYQINSLPTRETQEILSKKIGFSVSVIKTWFQNRRARDKRLKKTH